MPRRLDAPILPWLWGAVLATCLCYCFFTYAPGEIHRNDEVHSYVYRVVEFRDCLADGHPFPQWAGDFRMGLGSPYFGYYQPGFFYVASAFATALSPTAAIGATLWCFALLGYAGVYLLIRDRFGVAAGVLAGTALLLAPYACSELYHRGDFSEYAGMMSLPVLVWCLTDWIETGRASRWWGLALGSAVLVTLHPAAALLGFAMLGLALLWFGTTAGRRHRMLSGVAALLAGVLLAAVYWLPLVFEWNLVQARRATAGVYHYSHNFVDARTLLGLPGERPAVDVLMKIGAPTLALLAAGTLTVVLGRRTITGPAWRFVGFLWAVAALAVFAMNRASEPLWAALPLLHLLQFPWRFHVLLVVAIAALIGCVGTLRGPLSLVGVAALVVTTAPLFRPGHSGMWHFRPVTTARDIAASYFAPDGNDEWLPAGARVLRDAAVPTVPHCDPPCRIEAFTRGASTLRADVGTDVPTRVSLPQYYFRVGWHATLDGVPVVVGADGNGLIVVPIPRRGRLVLDFAMTPWRRRGLVVAVLTASALLVAGLAGVRRGATAARATAA